MKYLAVVLMFLFTFISHSKAKCNFITANYIEEMTTPSNILSINIEVPKSSKYYRNLFKIVTLKTDIIPSDLKKKFKAFVTVKYMFGNCRYQAVIRQNGDRKDHVKFVENGSIQSLDVKLKDGNIINATRFKLLIPETRYGKNEILATLILKKLGFVAPETFEVNAVINNVKAVMLFQERAEKELLERNFRREGPIFEGDESLLWSYKNYGSFELEPLSLSRLTNDNWFKKGDKSKQIVLKSYQQLQSAYLNYGISNLNNSNRLVVFPNFLKNKTFINYHSVLIAMNGNHALRPHNRKYYYNAIEEYFEPIYYDGNILFSPPKYNTNLIGSDEINRLLPIKPSNKFIESALKIDLTDELKKNFMERILFADYHEAFFSKSVNQFKQNISQVLSNVIEQDFDRDINTNNKDDKNLWYINFQKEKQVDQTIINRINFKRSGSLLHLKDQSTLAISDSDLLKIVSRNKLNGKRAVFIPENNNNNLIENEKVKFISLGSKRIKLSKGMNIDIDEKNKRLKFSQTSIQDWVLFLGGDYSNWELIFQGAQQSNVSTELEKQRFNEFGLTGCLTFYKTLIDYTKLSLNSGGCEDSINFIDSDGKGISLNVEDAFADAVDADFSRLSFNSLKVINAGNDCFDVSSGQYFLEKAIFNHCGDKGISVGEMSSLSAKDIFVSNSDIGVSSKDFSKVYIESLYLSKVTQCAEAKRKKQEFGGAILKIINVHCASSYDVDSESKILVNNL